MSHRSSESTHSGTWAPQGYLQNGDGYTPSANGYRSRTGKTPLPPGADASYYPQYFASSGAHEYSYGAPNADRASYMQSTSSSSSGYPVQTATEEFGVTHHTSGYANGLPQYSQQPSQPWTQAHSSQVVPHSQSMVHPQLAASPVQYGTAPLPRVAPRMPMAGCMNYPTSSTWPPSVSPISESFSAHSGPASQQTESGAEYTVPCPYNCGTVLTGVHAVGNMTRHLKSQNCVGSGRERPKHVCPVDGCDKRYIRSDGLKVHLRKRHNISQPNERQSNPGFADGGYGYS